MKAENYVISFGRELVTDWLLMFINKYTLQTRFAKYEAVLTACNDNEELDYWAFPPGPTAAGP